MDTIRVSAAGLARITWEEEYLVALNHTALQEGDRIYTPLGGALEFREGAQPVLATLNADFEKGRDLRFTMPDTEKHLHRFETWFYHRTQRETSLYRELEEELVEEAAVLDVLPPEAVESRCVETVEQRSTGGGRAAGQETQRYFELYNVSFQEPYHGVLRDAADDLATVLTFVSATEILDGHAEDGTVIAPNCEPLLRGR